MLDRDLLQRLIQGPASGAALAAACGVSRAAMWKRIEALREAGIEIQAQAGRGYQLATPVELLDQVALRAMLSPAAQAELASLEVAFEIDSTNSALLRAPAPEAGCTVLLAERQSGGRGRRGRSWVSPLAAHLYLSVSRGFGGGLSRLGGLSLAAGVAVAEALRALGVSQVGLKWPNDLVVGQRKLGGLLVEGGGEHAGPARAVLGLGLNWRMPPDQAAQIDQPWTDLCRALQPTPSRQQLAASVLEHLLPALAQFDREGLAPFQARYAALDSLKDQPVRILLPQGGFDGLAQGIAADGALQVLVGQERRSVHAGEVSVRRA
ncbi:bifunctional biotin--[acetyl-CoA-carboxylase] ligase/biotin operon repressor BirA [Pseudoxanthomonas composti]|uniref:Bifunctional ligase/repressor BirA n=1 Tax=Pseudoxanthomonas composti TaxID=2137479 RepID=A0A4Q1JY66_9GAMM|nr:bifunctional biotin--[acetyl-CoA-carboxylase] ligase/biotin operon repressor BirA [Pseudoxanthomonas composti]RXR06629.1 bifunctional biotin--[acetyl-CoA-carboxylase] ligase/biotin operon repressor BirA [Pseudoxanthomonas composti]